MSTWWGTTRHCEGAHLQGCAEPGRLWGMRLTKSTKKRTRFCSSIGVQQHHEHLLHATPAASDEHSHSGRRGLRRDIPAQTTLPSTVTAENARKEESNYDKGNRCALDVPKWFQRKTGAPLTLQAALCCLLQTQIPPSLVYRSWRSWFPVHWLPQTCF